MGRALQQINDPKIDAVIVDVELFFTTSDLVFSSSAVFNFFNDPANQQGISCSPC